MFGATKPIFRLLYESTDNYGATCNSPSTILSWSRPTWKETTPKNTSRRVSAALSVILPQKVRICTVYETRFLDENTVGPVIIEFSLMLNHRFVKFYLAAGR